MATPTCRGITPRTRASAGGLASNGTSRESWTTARTSRDDGGAGAKLDALGFDFDLHSAAKRAKPAKFAKSAAFQIPRVSENVLGAPPEQTSSRRRSLVHISVWTTAPTALSSRTTRCSATVHHAFPAQRLVRRALRRAQVVPKDGTRMPRVTAMTA